MCNACSPNVTASPSDAFAEKIVDMINHSATTLMISIGHRTGLFDTMAEMDVAGTSEEIAAFGNYNERYVREWLGAMWGEELAESMSREAGFTHFEKKTLEHDISNNFYILKK